MLRVYRILVRSVFDHGALVYVNMSPNKPNLQTRFIKPASALHYDHFQQPPSRIHFWAVSLFSPYVQPLYCSAIIKKMKQFAQHIIYTILNSQSSIFTNYINEWSNTLNDDLQATRPQTIKNYCSSTGSIISHNSLTHYAKSNHIQSTYYQLFSRNVTMIATQLR